MTIATSRLRRTSLTLVAVLALTGLATSIGCATESDAPNDDDPTTPSSSQATAGVGGAGAQGGGGTAAGGAGGSIQADVQTLVHQVSGEQAIASVDSAVAPDGTIYAAWTVREGSSISIEVGRSNDGGESFEAPTSIDTSGIDVTAFSQSAPTVAVSDSRVAVTFADKLGTNIWYTISDTSGALSFAAPTAVASGGIMPMNQFPTLAFGSDGELWIAWSRGESPPNLPMILRVFGARESQGFNAAPITDESNGRPCTCCGLDMLGMSDGEMLVTFRGMDSPRNQYVVHHPGGAGGNWTSVQASTTNWEFVGCPENGPALAEAPGGAARLAWTDPTSGESRVWLVDSDDGGVTWKDQRIAYDVSGNQYGSMLAIDPTGRTWVGWAPPINAQAQVVSSDDGYSFAAPLTLHIPEGDMKTPSVVSGSSGSFAFGVVEQQSLWIVSLQ